eukprot:3464647-Prymnesium_polylepis.1
MGRKRSARAPPPSTPSDADTAVPSSILPADAKVSSAPMPPVTNVTRPQELRTITVSLKHQTRLRLPEAARGAASPFAT